MAPTGGTRSRPSVSMKRAKYLLYAVIACPEPMTAQDLSYAYASQLNSSGIIEDNLITVDGIIDACGDFLTVTEGRYHLIHTSVSEFLMRSQHEVDHEDLGISYFRVDLAEAHESMCLACFRYIESIDLGYPLTDEGASSLSSRYLFVPYVASFLPFHLMQVQERKGKNREEILKSCGTQHFSALVEYLLVTLHNSVNEPQSDFSGYWTEFIVGWTEWGILSEHFNRELRRRLQSFGAEHERYQSWLYLSVLFPVDSEQHHEPQPRPANMAVSASQPFKSTTNTMLSSIPRHIGQSRGLAVQKLSRGLGVVFGMFVGLRNSGVSLLASSVESLSVPMMFVAMFVSLLQQRFDLTERLAVSLARRTTGRGDFYELCSLSALAGIKVNLHEEYSQEAEGLIRKSIAIANGLPSRPQIEFLKATIYNILISILINTGRSEEASEYLQVLERLVGKNREKSQSFVWEYTLSRTGGGFGYRLWWLHKLATSFNSAGEYATAADLIAQAIDVFQESGSKPDSDLIDFYSLQFLALFRTAQFDTVLSICDQPMQILDDLGSGAQDVHARWKFQYLRALSHVEVGNMREAERSYCEAADEVYRLGIERLLPKYHGWLVDMAQTLAYLGHYSRSMTMCRDLVEINQAVPITEVDAEEDRMFVKLRPLFAKLERAGFIDPDYAQFLGCFSILILMSDSARTSGEADWWKLQTSSVLLNIPAFKEKAPLFALKRLEACLQHDSELGHVVPAYEALAGIYFKQGNSEAVDLVSSDATLRLLSNFSSDTARVATDLCNICMSGSQFSKCNSWLSLAYNSTLNSTLSYSHEAFWTFHIETHYASTYAVVVETFEEKFQMGVRDIFIEKTREHLARGIEQHNWMQLHCMERQNSGDWSQGQGYLHCECDEDGNDRVIGSKTEVSHDAGDELDVEYEYSSKERRESKIEAIMARLEALKRADVATDSKARLGAPK
ncbi:hypothetical protein ACHAP7_011733, partial [Fusarium lateritium]